MFRQYSLFMIVVFCTFFMVLNDSYAQDLQRGQGDQLPRFLRDTESEWAVNKLNSLSLEEKIAQFFMVATWPNKGARHEQEIDSLIQHYKIGGLIFFQGDWKNTKERIHHFQQNSSTPLLMGMDAEWGSAMRLWKQPHFPYQLTMGAANLPAETKTIGHAMGKELNELGIHMNFSPVMDVNTNPNNPIIGFRSFGADPLVAGKLGSALIRGMEEEQVLTCMKHFPGHGDTDMDSHLTLPTVNKSLQELEIIDWTPFKMGRLAGASAVMMAHLNVPALDDSGTPTSLSRKVIQDYLKGKLKFSGLVVSDALNMKAVSERYGETEVVVKAFEAGNDILLYPSNIASSIAAIKDKVLSGTIDSLELDERCLKVLQAKYHAIIKTKGIKSLDSLKLDLAKTNIYEKAITVLKNDSIIPVKNIYSRIATVTVGIADEGFESRFNTYAKTDRFHAYSGTEVIERLLDTLQSYDLVILNLHANHMWPFRDFGYPQGWRELLKAFPVNTESIVQFFGNPYVIDENTDFEAIDAVILAYENTTKSQERSAQLLFGSFQGKTKLPVTLTNKYQSGFGVTTPKASRLKYTIPEELGISRKKLEEIDSIALEGIREGAYPGCQVVVAIDGKLIYEKSFGFYTYDSTEEVTPTTIYDIASITKIASSTITLMHLQDRGKFSLDDRLMHYLPEETANSSHRTVLMRDMLTHQAGLTPWIPFYTKTISNGLPMPEYYSSEPNDSMQKTVADRLYILNNYEDIMYDRILNTPLRGGKRYKYSDIGYYHIKRLVEKQHPKGIDDYATTNFYKPMGLHLTRFRPLNHFNRSQIAPTEVDSYFRNQLLWGHVHDMGAAMTDGVNGHAGLFSNATDLAKLMQMLLNDGIYGGTQFLSKEVVEEYTSCQFCPRNRRGAGFDKPVADLDGGPTCDLVSLRSFGHSGFTGTQVWADPEFGVNYVFLSNRVYPDAENWKLVKMNIRTEIQRVIYEALQEATIE